MHDACAGGASDGALLTLGHVSDGGGGTGRSASGDVPVLVSVGCDGALLITELLLPAAVAERRRAAAAWLAASPTGRSGRNGPGVAPWHASPSASGTAAGDAAGARALGLSPGKRLGVAHAPRHAAGIGSGDAPAVHANNTLSACPDGRPAPTWRESRLATQALAAKTEIGRFRDKVGGKETANFTDQPWRASSRAPGFCAVPFVAVYCDDTVCEGNSSMHACAVF